MNEYLANNLDWQWERLLVWIVLLPLFGAILNGLFGRFASKRVVSTVGVGSVALSFVVAMICIGRVVFLRYYAEAPAEDAEIGYRLFEWFRLSIPTLGGTVDIPIGMSFSMDSLGAVMVLVVTGVGLLIHVYSVGYMHEDPGYARFFAYLNLFMASMLVLVLASNLPVMFIGWEGVGLCSYLLIGFWYKNADYAAAGKKAFVMNRIGDFGVLVGMFILAGAAHSFEFDTINAATDSLARPFEFGSWQGSTIATVACAFLFLGCTGKSAQIPLYTWLPDAMAGPTPVSALIHAATMVTSGVYLCCRLSPVFLQAGPTLAAISLIGAATAFLAATIGMAQNDMKKILAYSTVSQLGFMFAAVGVGAFSAAIFHVFTHAFFKACLFLGAGSVMHAVGAHGDADIRKLGGLKQVLPRTHATFLVACLAIAGVPGLAGFFSKDAILLGAVRRAASSPEYGTIGWIVFGILGLTAAMTAFYMFRLYFLTFTGRYRSAAPERDEEEVSGEKEAEPARHHDAYDAHPHESPGSMTWPLILLAAGSVVSGWLSVELLELFHFDFWGEWLEPAVDVYTADVSHQAFIPLLVGLAAMIIGILGAWIVYAQRDGGPARAFARAMPRLHEFVYEKWWVDELYDAAFVRPIAFVATVSGHIDNFVVDGLFTKATAGAVRLFGWASTRLQTGVVYSYAAIMVVGIGVIGWWFLYPHPYVEAEARGTEVTYTAGRGLGYAYRWDGDDDGEFETGWDENGAAHTQAYDPEDYVGFTFRSQGRHQELIEVPIGRLYEVPLEVMSEDEWQWQPAPMCRSDQECGEGAVCAATTDEGEADDPTDPARCATRCEDGQGCAGWQRCTEDARGRSHCEDTLVQPVLLVRQGRLFLRANSGRVRTDTGPVDDEIELHAGDEVNVGGARVEIGALVRARLEVRNVFGNVAAETIEVPVMPAGQAPAGEEVSLR